MLKAQSTAKAYIRAEGDFDKEIYSWKDQYDRYKTRRTEWESGELLGEIYRMKYSWKDHKDRNRCQEQDKKEWASSVALRLWHKPQHPHHVKVCTNPGDTKTLFINNSCHFPFIKLTYLYRTYHNNFWIIRNRDLQEFTVSVGSFDAQQSAKRGTYNECLTSVLALKPHVPHATITLASLCIHLSPHPNSQQNWVNKRSNKLHYLDPYNPLHPLPSKTEWAREQQASFIYPIINYPIPAPPPPPQPCFCVCKV